MIYRCFFRFHYQIQERIRLTQYYLQNKQFCDQICSDSINSVQFSQIKQQINKTNENEAKLSLCNIALENCVMKEKLIDVKEILNQYKVLIETNHFKNDKIKLHDQGDYLEKEALVLLRECKMQEAFEPFKKSLQNFIDLSQEKDDYICRRIDQVLESMIMVIEDMGKIEQAREHIQQGLQIFEKLLGKTSDKYIQYLNKLANTYLTVDNQKAITLHKEALDLIGPMNEHNFRNYLKTAIELMITQFNIKFDQQLYDTINEGLNKFGNVDSELTVYYHVVMSHLFFENKDYQIQLKHLNQAYLVYQNEKSAMLMNIIVQKSLILQSEDKDSFYQKLIQEIDSQYADVLELQYYKTKIIYILNDLKGINAFKQIVNQLYQQKLTQFIIDFAQVLVKDGKKQQAINILQPYPEYSHLIEQFLKQ